MLVVPYMLVYNILNFIIIIPNTYKCSLWEAKALCEIHFLNNILKLRGVGYPCWASVMKEGTLILKKRHSKSLISLYELGRGGGAGRTAPLPLEGSGQNCPSSPWVKGEASCFSFHGYMKVWPLSPNTEVSHLHFLLFKFVVQSISLTFRVTLSILFPCSNSLTAKIAGTEKSILNNLVFSTSPNDYSLSPTIHACEWTIAFLLLLAPFLYHPSPLS